MPHFLSHQPPPTTTTIHRLLPPKIPTCLTNFRPVIHSQTSFTMLSPPPHHQIATTPSTSRTRVICMANARRVKMVARQIQREISLMLISDNVVKAAVLPEVGFGADRYLSSLTTVSDVEISNDLQVVKVYISVFGDEQAKKTAISGLKAKTKYVRGLLGKRMSLRLTPEIRFLEDDSIERGSQVLAILEELKNERKAKAQAGKDESSDVDEEEDEEEEEEEEDEDNEDEDEDEDDNWEDEDPNKENIIYVD